MFARIQLAVSLSLMHLRDHSANWVQEHGSCASSPHRKQKGFEQVQFTCERESERGVRGRVEGVRRVRGDERGV